jgi:hypothetical protein
MPDLPAENPERRLVLYTGPAAPPGTAAAESNREPMSPYADFFHGLSPTELVDPIEVLQTVGRPMHQQRVNTPFPEMDQNPELDSPQLRSLFAAKLRLADANCTFRIAGFSWRIQPSGSFIQCGEHQSEPPKTYEGLHAEILANARDPRLRAVAEHFGLAWGASVTAAQIAELLRVYLQADLRAPALSALVGRGDPESVALRDLSFRAALEMAEDHRAQHPAAGGSPVNGGMLNRLALRHVAQGRAELSQAFSRDLGTAIFVGAPPNGGAQRLKNLHSTDPDTRAAVDRQRATISDRSARSVLQALQAVQPGAPVVPAAAPSREAIQQAEERRLAENARRVKGIADKLDAKLAKLTAMDDDARTRKIGGWTAGGQQSYRNRINKEIRELAKGGVNVSKLVQKLKDFQSTVDAWALAPTGPLPPAKPAPAPAPDKKS